MELVWRRCLDNGVYRRATWPAGWVGRNPSPLSSPPAAQVAFPFLAGLQPTDARLTAASVDTSGPWDSVKTPSGAAKAALRREAATGRYATATTQNLKAQTSSWLDGWALLRLPTDRRKP